MAPKLTPRGKRVNEQRTLIDAQLKTLREIRSVKRLVAEVQAAHGENAKSLAAVAVKAADLERRVEALEGADKVMRS